MKKKRKKQTTILPYIQEQIEKMPENEEYGFAYAVNFALAEFFELAEPDSPGKRISDAARTVSSETRAAAGRRGGIRRAETLTPRQRKSIAKRAAASRGGKQNK